MKKSILISTEDVFFLLESICEGNHFLIQNGFEDIDKSQDNYMRVREDWNSKDIATLDFDGTLHPTMQMVNVLFILQNHRNEIRVEYEDVIEIWLLSNIEALCIRISGASSEFTVYRLSEIYYHLKRLRYNGIPLSITVKKDAISTPKTKVFEGDLDIEYDYLDEIYGGF